VVPPSSLGPDLGHGLGKGSRTDALLSDAGGAIRPVATPNSSPTRGRWSAQVLLHP
jgi:hypothetical protein